MLLSVIIPNWNGAALLPCCLDSLRRQTHREFETLVIDNGSTDGSISLMRESYPEVRLVEFGRNAGFTGAVNEGIRQAKGEIVVVLNNDTEADEAWLAELARAFAEHSEVAFCASKLLLFDRRNVIHSAGDYYRVDGVPGNRGVWQEDVGQFDASFDVFGACGGAAAYRKSLFDEIGDFDEDLWMYCEDVDLNLRARAAGHICRFVPTARVYHKLSASGGGSLASYYCGRNFVEVAVKNLPTETIRRHWARLLVAQIGIAGDSLRHFREPAARARLRGQLAAIRILPRALRKRRELAARRRVTVPEFERLLSR
jgi:GT2 family glycosyltransferase